MLQAMNATSLDRHLIRTAQRPDIVMARGEGSWLVDEQGKTYLDFMQGWAVNSLGHGHPAILQALQTQAQRLCSASPAFYNRPMLDLAERLSQVSGMNRCFLASTGAEANEGAVKLARRWGQKFKAGAHEIITFDQAFHGRTLAMMSASGKAGWDSIFAPMPAGFVKARFNDLDDVAHKIGSQTVAVMIEPVQGEAGVRVAGPEFLRGLRALADEHGLLLILDEVQTGVGRCGEVFAFQHFGIRPDLVTLAKGIGGGVPLSALLCDDAVDCFDPGDQGGTYTGNPLMAAVGLAVMDTVCEPAFLAQVRERAAQLSMGLAEVARYLGGGQERGLGLLRALELPRPLAAEVVARARSLEPHGLLLNAARPQVLRFMPALTVSQGEIDLSLSQLRAALLAAGF
jgi:acetylornithine/N-succinyldiaminopimelate aminotransferase